MPFQNILGHLGSDRSGISPYRIIEFIAILGCNLVCNMNELPEVGVVLLILPVVPQGACIVLTAP